MAYETRNHPVKGDLKIHDMRIEDARMRSLIAIVVVVAGIGLIGCGAAYAIISRDSAMVRCIVGISASMVGTILVFYFRRRK